MGSGVDRFKYGATRVELDDHTGDHEYVERLVPALSWILKRAGADLAFFIAGADPHANDRFGRLAMTFEGLAQRDALVVAACAAAGVPVCVVTGGGYGRCIDDSVTVHANTVRVLRLFVDGVRA